MFLVESIDAEAVRTLFKGSVRQDKIAGGNGGGRLSEWALFWDHPCEHNEQVAEYHSLRLASFHADGSTSEW